MELRNGRVVGLNGPLPVDRRPAFEEGVAAACTQWTALALAVENEWGGPGSVDKANGLIQDVIDWFYARKEYFADELEAELEAAMAEEFNVECEDGSPRQVANTLVELHNQLLQGGTAMLDTLRARQAAAPAAAAASKRQVVDLDGAEVSGSGSTSSSDGGGGSGSASDEDMGDGAPAAAPLGGGEQQQQQRARPEPVVDEDGFELVQGRRRGRR